jgi:tetratricopeptide (TPR) repeat protein
MSRRCRSRPPAPHVLSHRRAVRGAPGRPHRGAGFYRKALGEVPGHPAAAAALERLLEAAGEWDQLLEHLAASAETGDPGRKAALFLRQGEILRQHLDDHARAIERFEAVLTHERSLAALLALEPLYAEAGDWGALASVYDRQAEAFQDPAAQLGALREVVRLQESKGVGLPSDRANTYEAILALAPGDAEALNGLADVARRTSDSHMLARIYARLGEAEPDDSVASEHWLRLGHVLEAIEAPGALEAYRAALRKAPESLSAVRGLARLAQASGDTDTLVEATRREARLTVDPAEAARCSCAAPPWRWRGRGIARASRGSDPGARDLARRRPGPRAAGPVAVEEGRADRLADLLSRAADSARRPERQAALWLAVATVQADQLHNGGAAVAALRRALRVLPGHVEAHRALVGCTWPTTSGRRPSLPSRRWSRTRSTRRSARGSTSGSVTSSTSG